MGFMTALVRSRSSRPKERTHRSRVCARSWCQRTELAMNGSRPASSKTCEMNLTPAPRLRPSTRCSAATSLLKKRDPVLGRHERCEPRRADALHSQLSRLPIPKRRSRNLPADARTTELSLTHPGYSRDARGPSDHCNAFSTPSRLLCIGRMHGSAPCWERRHLRRSSRAHPIPGDRRLRESSARATLRPHRRAACPSCRPVAEIHVRNDTLP